MNLTIKNQHGETLDYSFSSGIPEQSKRGILVILGHGVTGNKDRPVVVDTANALNKIGFDTLRFSFSGNGDSEGDFRKATISKEIGDLQAVLDTVETNYERILYVGHSMGGAVGVLTAAKDSRIHGFISLAGMVNTKAFAETEFGEETPDQGCMWEDETCPLSTDFMNDLCEKIVTVEPHIGSIKVPWLLLHGTADDVVLPKDTETVASILGDQVKVVFVQGADHSFSEPAHKSLLVKLVQDWILTTFN